jgi:hypothetical protein
MPVREVDEWGQPVSPPYQQQRGQQRRDRLRAMDALAQSDWSLTLGMIAVWLAVVAFGAIIWAVNGGFSVIGLRVVAEAFNDAGRLLYAQISAVTFRLPVAVPGLATDQPLIPWIGVLAASILQVVVMYRKLAGLSVPPILGIAVAVLSAYDLGTTFFGLGTVAWVVTAGIVVRGLLAVLLTFSIEVVLSVLLRQLRR